MKVYDLINAGPNHRFLIRNPDGQPLLVSNCTQQTARHVFAERLRVLHAPEKGRYVLFTAHDEAIPECDDPNTDPHEIEKIMSVAPAWMPGLPVGAEAKLTKRYLK